MGHELCLSGANYARRRAFYRAISRCAINRSVFGNRVAIGHARNVVRHDARPAGSHRLAARPRTRPASAYVSHVQLEQLSNDACARCVISSFFSMAIEMLLQKALQRHVLLVDSSRTCNQRLAGRSHILNRLRPCRVDIACVVSIRSPTTVPIMRRMIS